MTGEHLAQPLWRADPRSKLDSAPLAHALRELAGERGLGEVEALAHSGALRREVRSVLRADRVQVRDGRAPGAHPAAGGPGRAGRRCVRRGGQTSRQARG
jgi:hypothetical protein